MSWGVSRLNCTAILAVEMMIGVSGNAHAGDFSPFANNVLGLSKENRGEEEDEEEYGESVCRWEKI